jgi:FkbM family methyltransferase
MNDYSQSGEQAAILEALKGIEKGRFLDIGAFNPKTFSNTRALYELGWNGVLVEPSPGPLQGIIEEYGNDDRISIVGAAVAIEHKLLQFHATNDAVSTSEPRNLDIWKTHGGFYGRWWTPTITIADILHQFGAFDFVNIDTEGTSLAIFRAVLQTEMYPKCICVEHDGQLIAARNMAKEKSYKMVDSTGENAVFSL